MNFPLKVLISGTRPNLFRSQFVSFTTKHASRQISKPTLRQSNVQNRLGQIEPIGWFLLAIPVASFSLGVWQIQRKQWKERLIKELKEKTHSDPVQLPFTEDEIKQLEYRPVHVRGTFLHDKEVYLGPRTLLSEGEATTQSSLIGNSSSQGYLVVTPFKLADRDEIILVNRGWVPANQRNPRSRPKGQVEGVVDVIGIVRLGENRPPFSIKNKPGSNIFFYRDLQAMCAVTGASPIMLDATNDFNVAGGPIGGQTRATLRNEHMSYILTWFSLGAATSYMWCKRFVTK